MADIFKMFKMMLSPTPGWIGEVERQGKAAKATVVSDPTAIVKGIGYKGRDGWVDVQVKVQPADAVPFDAQMKCKLSQAAMGALKLGMTVNVNYDADDKTWVMLMDDIHALLQSRVVKPQ